MALDNMEIGQAIERLTDKQQKRFLSDLQKRFPNDDDMRVTSRGPYFSDHCFASPARQFYRWSRAVFPGQANRANRDGLA